jgi:predicted metal-binding membrane protein
MASSMAHDSMMADMGMTVDMPWTATDVFFTFTMWAVMMVGMMKGTTAPCCSSSREHMPHARRAACRWP